MNKNKIILTLIIIFLILTFIYSFFIDSVNNNMTKKDWLELVIIEILAQEILSIYNKLNK